MEHTYTINNKGASAQVSVREYNGRWHASVKVTTDFVYAGSFESANQAVADAIFACSALVDSILPYDLELPQTHLHTAIAVWDEDGEEGEDDGDASRKFALENRD